MSLQAHGRRREYEAQIDCNLKDIFAVRVFCYGVTYPLCGWSATLRNGQTVVIKNSAMLILGPSRLQETRFRVERRGFWVATSDSCLPGEQGFEPRLTDPESVVLPLHYSPTNRTTINFTRTNEFSGCIILAELPPDQAYAQQKRRVRQEFCVNLRLFYS